MVRVLVIDDEWETVGALLAIHGGKRGFEFSGLTNFDADEIVEALDRVQPTVLLLDIMDSGRERAGQVESGFRVFHELEANTSWAQRHGSVQIVFFSNEASVRRHAVIGRARRVDVAGFVSKIDLLEGKPAAFAILNQAAELAAMYVDCPQLADPELRRLSVMVFSPNSRAMHEVWRKIVLAGRCHEPVFISGETGSGKELVANAVFNVGHRISEERVAARLQRYPMHGYYDFLSLNIAALPAEGNLQYLELFGAEPESYSGITKPRKGLFKLAHERGVVAGAPDDESPGATIFLDEIGDAAPIVQVALLRVLQEGRITPLGGFNTGNVNQKVAFRLISASHSLLANVDSGRFREDLYYRLNGLHIEMPPLCERKGDIGVLIQLFIDQLNKEYKAYGWPTVETGDAEALVDSLASYDWPGNVRELEMLVRASYVTTLGTTFQLSDEAKKRIAGRAPAPHANVEQLIESLRRKPIPITELAKARGVPVAIAIYLALAGPGRHLDAATVRQYFGPAATEEAVRKWVLRSAKKAGIDVSKTTHSGAKASTGDVPGEGKLDV